MKPRVSSAKIAHPPDSSSFELDTADKIDKKFAFFCKNYSYLWQNSESMDEEIKPLEKPNRQSQSTSSPVLYRSVLRKSALVPAKNETPFADYSSVLMKSKSGEKFRNIIKKVSTFGSKAEQDDESMEVRDKEAESKRLGQTLKQIYQDNYQNGVSKARKKVGEFFGNAVIAAFIEALINLSVDEVQRIAMMKEKASNLSLPPWLARSFGITSSSLQKFQTFEEKQAYVVTSMQKTIDCLLEKWRLRHGTRERLNEEENARLYNLKFQGQQTKKDQFSWLNVKTRFEHLKKNLRGLIVEKLNHYENQEKVVSALLCRKNSRSSPRTIFKKYSLNCRNIVISPNISQTFLDKIPTLTTKNVVQNMTFDSKILAENFWRTASVFYETGEVQHKRSMPSYEPPSGSKAHERLHDRALQDETVKAFQYPTNTEEKFAISEDLKEIFNWTGNRESEFAQHRSEAKRKYIKDINSSNWYELAFLPMVQEINLDFRKLKQRDLKLQKFAEGVALSAEDLKFIVDTSELLNSCVDRQFMQEAVDIIDQEVIQNLELYLAENILMNYQEIKSVIKESRLRYLELKNRFFHQKHKERKALEEREMKIKENREINKRKIFMFKRIWEKMGSRGLKSRAKAAKSSKPQMGMKETVRRVFHPPSKVMTSSAYEKNDIYDEEKVKTIKEINQKIAENYRLNLHSPIQLKLPSTFVNFYSGGPSSCKLPEKNIKEINFTQSDLAKIIKIQSHFRRFRTQKKVEHLKLYSQHKIKESPEPEAFSAGRSSKKKNLRVSIQSKSHLQPDSAIKSGMFSSKNSKVTQEQRENSTPIKAFESLNQIPFLSTQQSSKSIILMSAAKRKQSDSLKKDSGTVASSILQPRPRTKKNEVRVQKLFEAVKRNRFTAIQASVQIYEKTDVNEKDAKGNTPLYYAALNGNLEFCQFLINLAADVNEVCFNGDTPTHMACHSNHYPLIMLFLANNASLNVINNEGLTPLAFLKESLLRRLDLSEGIVSVTKKPKSINNNGLLVQGLKKREMGEIFLMHSFGKMVDHVKDFEGGKGKLGVSSFRSENWETQLESYDDAGGQGKRSKKISFGEEEIMN